MNLDRALNRETYRQSSELKRIGRRAVLKAQEESRKLRIPNVYALDGRIVYELPDGRLTCDDPTGSCGPELLRRRKRGDSLQ